MEQLLDLDRMPARYKRCFLTQCPRRSECLLAFVTEQIAKDELWGRAVFPSALNAEGGCPFFRSVRPVVMASGFQNLLANTRYSDMKALRVAIKQYLGNQTAYYRVNSGEKLLTPEQQEHILDLFRQFGYTDNLTFDRYVETYNF
jgi:hypothetical protein